MRATWIAIAAVFVLAVVNDLFLDVRPPGMMAAYGLVGCIAIIVVSKWFGKVFAQRPEDHYAPRGGIARETGPLEDREAGGG
jgi:hypothetical protein